MEDSGGDLGRRNFRVKGLVVRVCESFGLKVYPKARVILIYIYLYIWFFVPKKALNTHNEEYLDPFMVRAYEKAERQNTKNLRGLAVETKEPREDSESSSLKRHDKVLQWGPSKGTLGSRQGSRRAPLGAPFRDPLRDL